MYVYKGTPEWPIQCGRWVVGKSVKCTGFLEDTSGGFCKACGVPRRTPFTVPQQCAKPGCPGMFLTKVLYDRNAYSCDTCLKYPDDEKRQEIVPRKYLSEACCSCIRVWICKKCLCPRPPLSSRLSSLPPHPLHPFCRHPSRCTCCKICNFFCGVKHQELEDDKKLVEETRKRKMPRKQIGTAPTRKPAPATGGVKRPTLLTPSKVLASEHLRWDVRLRLVDDYMLNAHGIDMEPYPGLFWEGYEL